MFRRLALLIFILLSLSAPSIAQLDPEALSLGEQMVERFEADDKEGFLALFRQDTELSRRAYLAAMEEALKALHAEDSEKGEHYFIMAQLLAMTMANESGEVAPADILKAFEDQDDNAINLLLTYADQVYPGYREALKDEVAWLGADAVSPAPKGQPVAGDSDYQIPRIDPAGVSPEYFQVIRPLLVKIQRIEFAGMFDDKDLVLQELETFPDVAEATEQQAVEAGFGERFAQDFAYLTPETELNQLRLLADTGLLDEFDARVPAALAGPGNTADKISLLNTAYRVALRTQSWDRAESYLQQMKTLMKGYESPVFDFTFETGRYRLELARGREFTPVEVQQRFFSAWDTLSGYRPLVRVSDDVHFHLVRESARFWLDQLTRLEPAQNVQAILRINEDCVGWLEVGEIEDAVGRTDDRSILFYSPQMRGYLTVVMSALDVVMYVLETWKPMLEDRENYIGVVGPFPERIEDIAGSAAEMKTEGVTGPAFPEVDLGQAFLLAEMRARSRYLLALDPANTAEQKLAYLREASVLVDKLNQPESYIDYHLLLGRSFSSMGQAEEAISSWTKARDLATERRFVRRSLEASMYLAEEWGKAEEWEKAATVAAEASKSLEEELDSSSGLAQMSERLAEIQTRAAVNTDNPEAALVALNQNSQVQAATVRMRGESEGARATRDLSSKRKKLALLSRKVQEIQDRPSSITRDELLEKTQKLLAETRSDFLLESRKIRQKFSGLYSTALRFDPLNLPDIQSVLPAKTAVVQYFPTADELYVFVVNSKTFRLRSIQQKKQALDRDVLDYLNQVRKIYPEDPELARLSKALYNTLITPIEDDIKEADTLVLIPAGNLNILPFASLQGPTGRFLLEEKILLELAKPTDFLKIATTQTSPIEKVVVMANATLDLPAAEVEGKNIKELFPETQLFVGLEANKDNLMKFGRDADVLHLATHGVWDAENSLKNHLMLANKQELAQEEIFEMSLDSSIVTLSACNTAMGEGEDAKYVASLAEAFWIAGSRSVVATFWQVDDVSTGELMTRFYEELREGQPKGRALRTAQLSVKESQLFSHPYYWSGFMLFGDYR